MHSHKRVPYLVQSSAERSSSARGAASRLAMWCTRHCSFPEVNVQQLELLIWRCTFEQLVAWRASA